MGIQGLLPFLKDATEAINVRKYKGHAVAVDTYCWIHRGAVACALQLAKGEKCDQYVRYCLKLVNMLRSMDITPILVFDGQHLPAKKSVEEARRKRREHYKQNGKQLLREGKSSEARDAFVKCINVTSEMALDVMKAARSLGVDCIVAPYEADSQLAYLERNGFVQAIITEDSDLVAFGCKRVIFKLDTAGNALEIEQSRLNRAVKMGTFFSVDKFRQMCILAGCDYLPSLQGIGLGKARKFMHTCTNTDMRQVLKTLPLMMKLKVPITQEYIDGFIRAENTFLYQLAFDPKERKLMPLNPYPPELAEEDMDYAGRYLNSKLALQLALGNVDTGSLRKMFDFEPDSSMPYPKGTHHHKLSIWHDDYQPAPALTTDDSTGVTRHSTKGREMTVSNEGFTKRSSPRKRRRDENNSQEDGASAAALATMYRGSPDSKVRRVDVYEEAIIPETPSPNPEPEKQPLKELETLPQGKRMTPRNIFAVKKSHRVDRETRANLLQSEVTVSSRFFKSAKATVDIKEELQPPDQSEANDDLVTAGEGNGHIYEPCKKEAAAAETDTEEQPEVQDSIRDHQRKVRGTTGRLCDKSVDRTGVLDSLQKFQYSEFYEEQLRIKKETKERRQKTPPSSQTSKTSRKVGVFAWSSQRSKSDGVQKTLADSMKSLRSFHRKSNSQVMRWNNNTSSQSEPKEGAGITSSQESQSSSQCSYVKSSPANSESDVNESQSSAWSSKGLSSQISIEVCSIDRDGPTFSQLNGRKEEESSPSPGETFDDDSDVQLSPGDKELCNLLTDIIDDDEGEVAMDGPKGEEENTWGTLDRVLADSQGSIKTNSDNSNSDEDAHTINESPSLSNLQERPAVPSLGELRRKGPLPSNDEKSPLSNKSRKRGDETVSSYFSKGKENNNKSKESCKVPGLSRRKKSNHKTPSSKQQPTLMAFMKRKSNAGLSGNSKTAEMKMPLSPSKLESSQNLTPETDSVFILTKATAVRKSIFK